MLKAEPIMLKTFIDKTESDLYHINRIFKEHENYGLREKLKEIYAVVHTIKGNAASIGMTLYEQRMHDFEDAIVNVLDQGEKISGQDFIALAIKLESSLQLVETVRMFLQRIIDINRSFVSEGSFDSEGVTPEEKKDLLSISDFKRLVKCIGDDKGKKVVIEYEEFDPDLIPPDKHSSLRDIVLQLLRNSLVHGIEAPDERIMLNKTEIGRITLATKPNGKSVSIFVRDDGRGIDVNTIRSRALQSGYWPAEDVSAWDEKKLVSLIFEDRFSTAESADQHAGRGMGMVAVKQALKNIGGGLGIKFVPGRYCEFRITVPAI